MGTWKSYTIHADNAGIFNVKAEVNTGATATMEVLVGTDDIPNTSFASYTTPSHIITRTGGMHGVRINRKTGTFGLDNVIIGFVSSLSGTNLNVSSPQSIAFIPNSTVAGTNPTDSTTTITGVVVNSNHFTGALIYPNPSTGERTVTADANAQISILNMFGSKITTKTATHGNATFNLFEPKGIYLVEVKSLGNSTFSKLVLE